MEIEEHVSEAILDEGGLRLPCVLRGGVVFPFDVVLVARLLLLPHFLDGLDDVVGLGVLEL